MKKNVRLLVAACLPLVAIGGCDCIGGVNGTLTPPEFTTRDRVTNRAKFTVAGNKPANTSVTLQRGDDKPFEAVALDAAEDFSATVDLKEGENPFFAVAVDSAGRTSDPAGPLTITLDTVAPAAPVFDPIDTAVVVDNGADNATVIVSGTREADCTLQVVVGGQPLSRNALTTTGTSFSFPFAVPVGETAIEATCVDEATNRSEPATLTLVGAHDETPPAAPVVDPVDNPIVIEDGEADALVTFTGTREANSSITFDDVEAVALAASTSWSTQQNIPLGQSTISVRAVDRSGNISQATTVDVDVRHLPSAPIANPPALTNQPNLVVTGFCGDGTAVGVAIDPAEPAGLFDSLAACVGGEFSVDVALIEGANAYYLYAVDDVGLESVRVGPFSTVLDTVAPQPPVFTFPSCATTDPRTCSVFIATGQRSGPFDVAGTRDADAAIVVDGVRLVEPGSADWAGVITVALAETRVLAFVAVDDAGNASAPATVTVSGIAGLTLPTVECIGPYRLSGLNEACPVEIPEIRRAIRGDSITLSGVKVAGSGVRVHNLTTGNVTTLAPSQATTWSVTTNGLIAGRQDFSVSVFNAVSESSERGPIALRRDDVAPSAPTLVGLADFHANGDPDAVLTLDGAAVTRADQARITGGKSLDGDICVAQVVVTDQTCPGGVCPDIVFSECLAIAAADGLTEWGCATTSPTCLANLGLQPGKNRLCFESSDAVPTDGEPVNPNPQARAFVGNRSTRVCVDVERTVDPLPSFVRPVEGTLVRPGPLRVQIDVDQPVALTDRVRVCVGAGDAGCVDATEISTNLWETTVTIPAGAAGTPITLRADAFVTGVVRGTASISTTLLPGSLLVTDYANTPGGHRTVGAYSPQIAVGPSQEAVMTWEDDCWGDDVNGCPVRDTRGTATATLPTDIFLRTFADGALSRVVNVSDDPLAVSSTQPTLTVTPTGEIHVAWIDNGFNHPNRTLVHRVIGNDGRSCVTDANCGASSLCIAAQCHPVRQTTVVVDDAQPSGDPVLTSASTGEVVALWWKATDPSPDFKDTAYLKLGVYCSTDCNYDNGNVQPAGTWENADVTAQQRGAIIANPAVVVDDARNAWVAWFDERCTGPAGAGRCDFVGDFAIRFTGVSLVRGNRFADTPITIANTGLDSSSRPAIAYDSAGFVHIVWSTTSGVNYRRFDTLAQPAQALSPTQRLYDGPVGSASVVSIDANTAVVTWAPALGDCPVNAALVEPQAMRSV
jgi:hypothetical protein